MNYRDKDEFRETIFASAIVFIIILLLFAFAYEDIIGVIN